MAAQDSEAEERQGHVLAARLTEDARAAARRDRVRRNVQAFRARQRAKKALVIRSLLEQQSKRTCVHSQASKQGHEDDVVEQRSSALVKHETKSRPFAPDVRLPPEVCPLAIYQEGFIEALQSTYLPQQRTIVRLQYDPTKSVALNSAGWISVAPFNYNGRGADVILPAMTSAAMIIIGKENDNRPLLMSGLSMQTGVLRRLGVELKRLQAGDSSISADLLRMTMMFTAITELLGNNSWAGTARHLLGVAAFIERAGLADLNTVQKREQFYGFRRLHASMCFAYEFDSFLARPEWIHFPWKSECNSALRPFHIMLDIALPLLPELAKNKAYIVYKMRSELEKTLQWLKKMASDLDAWSATLEARYKEEIGQALYDTRPAKWLGLYDEAICFIDPTVAVALSIHAGIRVKLSGLMTRIYDRLAKLDHRFQMALMMMRVESLTWARWSCRSYEYFYEPERKSTPRIVTVCPFDASWEVFVRLQSEGSFDLSKELEWSEAFARRLNSISIAVFNWRSGSPDP